MCRVYNGLKEGVLGGEMMGEQLNVNTWLIYVVKALMFQHLNSMVCIKKMVVIPKR